MAARPLVTLADCDESVALPAVFTAPIRPDIVQITHTNMAKNKRQARGQQALQRALRSRLPDGLRPGLCFTP